MESTVYPVSVVPVGVMEEAIVWEMTSRLVPRQPQRIHKNSTLASVCSFSSQQVLDYPEVALRIIPLSLYKVKKIRDTLLRERI